MFGQWISIQSRVSPARMKTKEQLVGREPAAVTAVGPVRLSSNGRKQSQGLYLITLESQSLLYYLAIGDMVERACFLCCAVLQSIVPVDQAS